jgi:hypothetical protein
MREQLQLQDSDELRPETDFGQVYEVEERGELYQVVYADEQIVLLRGVETRRDGRNVHRIEDRGKFDQQRESDWFVHRPESDIDLISDSATVDWTQVPNIGEKTAKELVDQGFEARVDVLQATEDELTDVDGVGPTGATNLIQFSQ